MRKSLNKLGKGNFLNLINCKYEKYTVNIVFNCKRNKGSQKGRHVDWKVVYKWHDRACSSKFLGKMANMQKLIMYPYTINEQWECEILNIATSTVTSKNIKYLRITLIKICAHYVH